MELILRPDWPADTFRRTIDAGKKRRTLVFRRSQPQEVSDAEFRALRPDVGLSLVEVERDAKNRVRYVESAGEPAKEPAANVAHV